jgi:hypothetical protein
MKASHMNLDGDITCPPWMRTIIIPPLIAAMLGLGILCSGCIAGGSGYSMNYAPTNVVLGQPIYVEFEIHPRSRYRAFSRRDSFMCFYRSDSDASYDALPLNLISKNEGVLRYGCALPALTTSSNVLEYYFSYTVHGVTNQTMARQLTLPQDGHIITNQ